MSFPFQFTKSSGRDDLISPIVNFAGNALVVGVGGICLGVISHLAFNALGFSKIAGGISSALPVAIGSFGAISTLVGAGIILYLSAFALRIIFE